ncbi:MAG: LPS assembly protein LptD [Bdellovibrionaceae bacterium]|nr:LPS assembly protein LptD [Pseudobdellovibrionaceae bacterium]
MKLSRPLELLCFFLVLWTGLTFGTERRAFAQAAAKIQGISMNADSMFRDSENEIMELEGHVQIVYQTQHLKCDKARINLRTRQAELTGNVEIVSEKTTVGGTSATIDYENNTGIIYNGYVQSGPVVFSGAILQKASEDEYYVADADYTTCTNCPATWGFSGSNIRAELGGYAYIKNSFLKIYSVPVFWLPYLMVPLKSDRQSGLLTPRFENSSNGGLAFSESIFWAISPNTDATIAMTNYEKRGLKALGEYRYVLGPNSAGNLNTAFIADRVFKNDQRVTDYQDASEKGKSLNRWFAKYDHYYELPNDYIQRAQINIASDLQYPKDFPEETLNHGDSAMENRFSLTKNTFTQHYSVDSSYYVNLLQSNPLAANNSVQRLPELRFSQVDQKIGNSQFLYAVDVDYVNFARSGQYFDNMTVNALGRYPTNNCESNPLTRGPNAEKNAGCQIVQDGVFDPGTDLIRTGQRLDVNTSLYRPVALGQYIDLMPGVSYRETHYSFNTTDNPNNVRRYARVFMSAKTSVNRVFTMDATPKSDKYKHEIQPEIVATTIPWLNHSAHPFFGNGPEVDGTYYQSDTVTDADVSSPYGLQFDYNDRIYDRGLVTFILNNKLVQKSWSGDTPSYRQIVNFKIQQSYDTYQANLRDRSRDPWSDIAGILDVRLDHVQTYTTMNYFPTQKVTNMSSRVRLNNDYGQFFQIALAKTYVIKPGNPEVDKNTRIEDYTFGAGFVSSYINMMGKFVFNANSPSDDKKIKSSAYVIQFKPPGECWIINFAQYLPTDGDTKSTLDFVFSFDGTTKPPLPPETLDLYGF